MKKAIVTFGVGYQYNDIKYFLESCQQYCPEADVYIYVGKNIETLRKQCWHFQKLQLIRFNENIFFNAIAKILIRVPALNRAYAEWIQAIWRKKIFPKRWTNSMVSPMLQFMVRRFFLIEELMKDKNYQQIMLTDLRDVVLQSDPFVYVTENTIITGIEPVHIAESEMNSRWLANAYSADTLENLKFKHVVCAGVTVGSGKAVRQYVSEMNEEIYLQLPKLLNKLGPDQAIHMYLFYERLKGLDKYLETNGAGTIATLHYSPLTEFNLNNGKIENPVGKKLAVVHQYDRHPELAEFLRTNLIRNASHSIA